MRVVFVHGAIVRDGAWWWSQVASVLERDGVTSAAVALPSCGEHDVADPRLVRGAHERLTAQSAVVFATPVTAAAWQRVPTTYLVCAHDRSTSPDLQRSHATRANHVEELATGHHPMLSRPGLVAGSTLRLASAEADG